MAREGFCYVLKKNGLIFLFELIGTMGLTFFYRSGLHAQYRNPDGTRTDESTPSHGFLAFLFANWIFSFLSWHSTGAHYNPGLTLAQFLTSGLKNKSDPYFDPTTRN